MKMPEDQKKIKISLSIDPGLNKAIEKIIEKKFYKKSRFIEFLIKEYINKN